MLDGVVAAGLALRTIPTGAWASQWVETRDRVTAQLDEVAQSLRGALTAQSAGERLTILAVDDEPDILAAELALLSRAGYRTVGVSDGMRCLQAFGAHRPDAVLLDISMPGLSGWEILREIRRISDTPVLIVTAHAQAESDRLRGFAEGADDYISKPYSSPELVARIQAILRRASQSASADSDAAQEQRSVRVAIYPDRGLREWLLTRPAFAGWLVGGFADRHALADALETRAYDFLILDGRTAPVDGRLVGQLTVRGALDVPVLIVGSLITGTEEHVSAVSRVALLGEPFNPVDFWGTVERMARPSRWSALPI